MDLTRLSQAPYLLALDSQTHLRENQVMDHRTFVASTSAILLATRLVAEAQQAGAPVRIGFLPLGSPSGTYDLSLVEAFR